MTPADTIRLALPSKGHLYEGVVDILKTRGYLNVILFGSISQWKGDLQ